MDEKELDKKIYAALDKLKQKVKILTPKSNV